MYKNYIKRIIDIISAIILLIILVPILLVISILVWAINGTPILFRQKRPGLHERIFTIYKFRTMNNDKDTEGNLLPGYERITRFGNFLRKSSIDELPELINILKGDMSFVGPRPLLVQYLPLYNETQKRRHSLRPGLTGLAQINGRNATTWTERFNYDIFYVDNISLWLDCKIILKTMYKTIRKEGINLNNNETMKAFNGNE